MYVKRERERNRTGGDAEPEGVGGGVMTGCDGASGRNVLWNSACPAEHVDGLPLPCKDSTM